MAGVEIYGGKKTDIENVTEVNRSQISEGLTDELGFILK